ncbi:Crp/Fnr family transcriptional regulator [Amycolatopsis roodepoortensis]|uniref:Crp/Fnr family transcriptional regulator n=1 Tax=Amycolatopsis roodepoortensis TaxID=700274 RepID=UPI0027D77F29|nr:Crp/Fnr family transcriptional regulator [Amycolatopsis roodepoortensis]
MDRQWKQVGVGGVQAPASRSASPSPDTADTGLLPRPGPRTAPTRRHNMSTTSQLPANASLHTFILECGDPFEFPRDHVIFHEGEPGDRLYVVKSGKVKIGTGRDGKEALLRIVGPDDMFGDLSLLDLGPRSATATTLTETLATAIDRTMLKRIIRSDSYLVEELLRIQARRVRRASAAVQNLAYNDVPARLARALLQSVQRFGSAEGSGYRVVHDLTQIELAQLVGAARETVNKTLADFVRRGWIRVEGKSVLITDPERLARRAR